ncbi:MAG TPA: S53 family peptidase [Phycisphaerae bacterium]|nr:S53 family peptidase [Phycisphaerae bacterium]
MVWFAGSGSKKKRNNHLVLARCTFEQLEPRILLSSSTISGPYTPYQIREAYQFNQLSFTNSLDQSVTADGAGQTIAIIDAYYDPTIARDVNTFAQSMSFNNQTSLYQQFGAASSFLTQVVAAGAGSAVGSGWAIETALDVEWAHAIAPAAKILLVEAQNSSFGALFSAINYAKSVASVDVVSMSWGGGEFSSEGAYDNVFTTPAGHQGITFVASAGDTGGVTSYPAVSPNVLSVGGTTLNLTANGTWASESAWSDGGGGLSKYEPKPAYQSDVETNSNKLASPDVSYDANPDTGVYVADSSYIPGGTSWYEVGGTSAGAPQWAALVVIADQGRQLAGKTSLNGATQLLPALFSAPNSDFHDITTGTNGYKAGPGFDLATGLGTPIANQLIPYLVNYSNGTQSSSASGVVNSSGPSTSKNEVPKNATLAADTTVSGNAFDFIQVVKVSHPSNAGQNGHVALAVNTVSNDVINSLESNSLFNPLDQLQLGLAV